MQSFLDSCSRSYNLSFSDTTSSPARGFTNSMPNLNLNWTRPFADQYAEHNPFAGLYAEIAMQPTKSQDLAADSRQCPICSTTYEEGTRLPLRPETAVSLPCDTEVGHGDHRTCLECARNIIMVKSRTNGIYKHPEVDELPKCVHCRKAILPELFPRWIAPNQKALAKHVVEIVKTSYFIVGTMPRGVQAIEVIRQNSILYPDPRVNNILEVSYNIAAANEAMALANIPFWHPLHHKSHQVLSEYSYPNALYESYTVYAGGLRNKVQETLSHEERRDGLELTRQVVLRILSLTRKPWTRGFEKSSVPAFHQEVLKGINFGWAVTNMQMEQGTIGPFLAGPQNRGWFDMYHLMTTDGLDGPHTEAYDARRIEWERRAAANPPAPEDLDLGKEDLNLSDDEDDSDSSDEDDDEGPSDDEDADPTYQPGQPMDLS